MPFRFQNQPRSPPAMSQSQHHSTVGKIKNGRQGPQNGQRDLKRGLNRVFDSITPSIRKEEETGKRNA